MLFEMIGCYSGGLCHRSPRVFAVLDLRSSHQTIFVARHKRESMGRNIKIAGWVALNGGCGNRGVRGRNWD